MYLYTTVCAFVVELMYRNCLQMGYIQHKYHTLLCKMHAEAIHMTLY